VGVIVIVIYITTTTPQPHQPPTDRHFAFLWFMALQLPTAEYTTGRVWYLQALCLCLYLLYLYARN
jgi:hypothetical protein